MTKSKNIIIMLILYAAANVYSQTEDIREYLNSIEPNYWPLSDKLSTKYIGSISELNIYKTELVWGSASHITHRLILLSKDKSYLGEYDGIQSSNILIRNQILVFIDIDSKYGNTIDFSKGIPVKVWIDGFVIQFTKIR